VRRNAPLAAVLLALAGCGGGGGAPGLRISAASSLRVAFARYAAGLHPAAAVTFAGSDELAAQIRAGARPDVFAAANAKLPDALYAAHLVERPVAFATNRLVLAVPADSSIRDLAGAARAGVRLALGSATVPVGAYTATVLGRLPAPARRAIEANVRTREPDVASIVAKLQQHVVDAGFVYISDVRAAGGALRAIELPAALRPRVVYAAAVVRGSRSPARARAFVSGLLRGAGARDLRVSGLGPAP
jgi:molybdate transport system substrate-binding protein